MDDLLLFYSVAFNLSVTLFTFTAFLLLSITCGVKRKKLPEAALKKRQQDFEPVTFGNTPSELQIHEAPKSENSAPTLEADARSLKQSKKNNGAENEPPSCKSCKVTNSSKNSPNNKANIPLKSSNENSAPPSCKSCKVTNSSKNSTNNKDNNPLKSSNENSASPPTAKSVSPESLNCSTTPAPKNVSINILE